MDIEAIVAKSLFHTDLLSSDVTLDASEKKKQWADNKKNYRRAARRFIRLLEKQGVKLKAISAPAES